MNEPMRRLVAVSLAILLAALASILSGATASAMVGTETRVGAFNVAGGVLAEPLQRVSAGQRLGNDVAGPRIVVATGVAANTGARFAVNSAGEATMSLRAGSGALEVSEHAALRMTQRGVSIDAAESTLAQKPFQYFHNNVWKAGYYDPASRVFLGSVNGQVTTVISRASPTYINNLKAALP